MTGQVPMNKQGCTEKFCQSCKAHGGPYQTPITLDCRCYNNNVKPLEAAAGKPAESKKSDKKFRGNKSMAFMQTKFEAYVKAQRAGKSKKGKQRNYDSSDRSDNEQGTESGDTGFSVDKHLKVDENCCAMTFGGD